MATASITSRPFHHHQHQQSQQQQQQQQQHIDDYNSVQSYNQHRQHQSPPSSDPHKRSSYDRPGNNNNNRNRQNALRSTNGGSPSSTARQNHRNTDHSASNTQVFYVPEDTPCFVSCDDGSWHAGLWGDNRRSVTIFRAGRGPNPTFVRFADVVLKDAQGYPMYMAANRTRPCFIVFPQEVPVLLYIESSTTTSTSNGNQKGSSKTAGFTPVSINDAFTLGMEQFHQQLIATRDNTTALVVQRTTSDLSATSSSTTTE